MLTKAKRYELTPAQWLSHMFIQPRRQQSLRLQQLSAFTIVPRPRCRGSRLTEGDAAIDIVLVCGFHTTALYAVRRRDLAKVSKATARTIITPMMICCM